MSALLFSDPARLHDGNAKFSRLGRMWSLNEMIELKIKPLIDAQDVLAQMSVLMHSNDNRLVPELDDVNKDDLRRHIDNISKEMASSEFDMCLKGLNRLRATLDRTSDAKQILGEIDDVRRRPY